MSVEMQIIKAALDKLQSGGPPGVPVAWPGISFDPPSGPEARWLEASIFPAEPDNIAWQSDSPHRYEGFIQVLVGFRPNRLGAKAAWDLAGHVIALYPKGTQIGPVKVSRRPGLGPLVAENGRNSIPVTIRYLGVA